MIWNERVDHMQHCSITELRSKEVISVKDGVRVGFVSDVEIDVHEGRLTALLIWGKSRLGGLLGREGDLRIAWENVRVIGSDTILVDAPLPARAPKRGMDFLNKS